MVSPLERPVIILYWIRVCTKVEYADIKKSPSSTNLIAENMFTQIDKEGNIHVLMDDITYHQFDEVDMNSHGAFVATSSGTQCRSQTTQGVSLCIKCHDGNTTWVALKYLKEDYPIKLADCVVVANISMDTTFNWWVPHNLKNRNCIILKVKSKYWLKTHKFGIKVPKNMKQAIQFDR